MSRKRKQPGDTPIPTEDKSPMPTDETTPVVSSAEASKSSAAASSSGRSKPTNPTDTNDGEATNPTKDRPPLSEEEQEPFDRESKNPVNEAGPKLETPQFMKRLFASLLGVGFGLLALFFMLQTAQAINAILSWSPWVAWPLVILIFFLIGYVIFRLGVMFYRLRKLLRINRGAAGDPRDRNTSERKALRVELGKHLDVIAKQESEANPTLAQDARKLKDDVEKPSNAWLEQYVRNVQKPLAEAAEQDVRKIALTAGVSAAFSPWRLLDTLIAFNASVEAAQYTLQRFGIHPDGTTTMAFAFDTFLATFFAATVDEISEDLAVDLQEHLGGEFAGNAVGYLGPKLAQGIGIAYFVRRLGRRMIRRLETVKLSE